jgi:hypothetical protein
VEGSWYISKSSEYLPNLKVTSGGAVVYNFGTSGYGTNGISRNGTHIGGSAGSSYIQPVNMFQLDLLGAKLGKNLVILKLI